MSRWEMVEDSESDDEKTKKQEGSKERVSSRLDVSESEQTSSDDDSSSNRYGNLSWYDMGKYINART